MRLSQAAEQLACEAVKRDSVGLVKNQLSMESMRGYPETFQHCRASVKQLPGGNEIQGGRMARVCSASDGGY